MAAHAAEKIETVNFIHCGFRRGLIGFTALLSIFVAMLAPACALFAAAHRPVGAPPAGIQAGHVEFRSDSGSMLQGWLVKGVKRRGAVILLHPLHADRRSNIRRMSLLQQAGYTVLAFDFQAHGESPGKEATLGLREGQDALAAVLYIKRKFPDERIGVIGVSMGAAAALLAPRPLPVQALVLESVYPDFDHALCHYLESYLGHAGCLLAPLYIKLMLAFTGIHDSELRPIDHIALVKAPLLFLTGEKDAAWVTPDESRDIFARAPEPKDFWLVEGASHTDFFDYNPDDYRHRVMPFLARYLQGNPR